jgi:hypothetical protein
MLRAVPRTVRSTAVLALSGLCACGGAELPGHYFDVRLEGAENGCTDEAPGSYGEEFEYRLELDVNDATLAIGDDIFATGSLEGCQLNYTSLVWTSYRDNKEITWQIVGQARIDLGGGEGCVVGTSDWDGIEQFVVLSSNADDVSAGCTYDLTAGGTWSREVE